MFGYGSLIWRPDMPWVERSPGWIEGWRRRFWQGSTDHRGIPGAPGRVVTLDLHASSRCWGMAYRVDAKSREAVLAGLDHREKGGYRRLVVPVHFRERASVEALTWVATRDNQNYLGPATLDEIAEQVVASAGPSGPNLEYVVQLARALRAMDAPDAHVEALTARVESLTRET